MSRAILSAAQAALIQSVKHTNKNPALRIRLNAADPLTGKASEYTVSGASLSQPANSNLHIPHVGNLSPALFTSNTDQWATPQSFFDRYDAIFNFELDVCADEDNAKCVHFFDKEMDGLTQEWTGVCWMNPPYGRTIKHWVRKAYESSLKGATVVCLLPSRTGTSWFQDYCLKGEIEYVRGRISFGDGSGRAPFDNIVVVFRAAQKQRVAA